MSLEALVISILRSSSTSWLTHETLKAPESVAPLIQLRTAFSLCDLSSTLPNKSPHPLSPQQYQPNNRQGNPHHPWQRHRLFEKEEPRYGNQRRTASQNHRHRRQRPTFLKQQKEENRTDANADSCEDGIKNPRCGDVLIP